MSTRLAALLFQNSLSLFQAFRMADEDLLAIKGFGQKALEELREIQYGIRRLSS